jgi:prepilin peptidase CpaA
MDMFTQGTIATTLALTVFSAAMLYAALRDVTTFTIPNGLVLWLATAYGLMAPMAGLGPRAMLFSLGVAAMVFFITIAAFALGWMGGGDSKLLTVAALWLGPQALPQFLIVTMVLGGLLALSMLTLRLLPAAAAGSQGGWLMRLRSADAGVPYGLPIGLAALYTLPQTGWMGGF